MSDILQIAVHVQRGFYQRETSIQSDQNKTYNDYAATIARGIQDFSRHPRVTTIWAIMPYRNGKRPTGWDESIVQLPQDAVIGDPENQLFCTPQPGDFVAHTPDGSAFGNSGLRDFIERKNFQAVAVTGSYFYGCAARTFEHACTFFPNLNPAMITDLCGSYFPSFHERDRTRVREGMAKSGLSFSLLTADEFWRARGEEAVNAIRNTPRIAAPLFQP